MAAIIAGSGARYLPRVDYPVQALQPLATRPLRWEVLRAGQPPRLEDPLQGDEVPGTLGLGVLEPGSEELVACGLLVPAPVPPALAEVAAAGGLGPSSWRLRGMAVRADRRRQGLGAAVVAEALRRAAEAGGGLFWCHARLAAVSLYERAGMVPLGQRFEEAGAGPHLLMWRLLASSGGGPPAPGAVAAGRQG